jgi:hypothetical protein
MKIHFLAFGSSFDLFSSGTCTYTMQPNTLGVRLQLLPLQPKSNLANSSHSTWHVLLLQCAYFSFQQLHYVVQNNYMSTSLESMLLQVLTEFI